ncbi:rhomboid family intramembrane serine protease [Sphingosinithalassobacter sp. LHW66-3]|uniref:rhomboid family intramembrane serine protease n=1 Tax=Sphingosinithalassobacter sp. LHW66-3 TaxID=3424718 RepID=UPI003D6BFCB2
MPVRTATAALVLATSAVSLIVVLSGALVDASVIAGFIPARASGVPGFEGYGLLPVWLTPLSCTFVHAGVLHLGMNMLMLGFTGRETERAVGVAGLLLLYVAGAYSAAAAQWLLDPDALIPMVGASGAASAVIGAYSLLFSQPRVRAIGPIPERVVHVLWLAVAWTIVNLLMWWALLGGGLQIAAAAHIGGFIAGLLLARPLLLLRWRRA